MKIEAGRSRFPAGVGPVLLDAALDGTRIVAILDGTGSWEGGDEEARAVATVLRATWFAQLPSSAGELIDAVTSAMHVARSSPAGESFGRPGFSFVAAVIDDDRVSLISCGAYAILHLHDDATNVLYRPRFWIDEQMDAGALTRAQARTHQLRHVYTGPLLSRGADPVFTEIGPIGTGRIVIATMELARTLLDTPRHAWSHESAEALQDIEHDGAAHMRPVVVIDPGEA